MGFFKKREKKSDLGSKTLTNTTASQAKDNVSDIVFCSQVLENLLNENNSSKKVYADSAYSGAKISNFLKEQGLQNQINKKGYRNRPLTSKQQASNQQKSKTRCRVEHVFGVQSQRAGGLFLRCIGIVRAKTKIGLQNLSYNMSRYAMLKGNGS